MKTAAVARLPFQKRRNRPTRWVNLRPPAPAPAPAVPHLLLLFIFSLQETQSAGHVVLEDSHMETFLTGLRQFTKMLADIDEVWPDICASTHAAFSAALDLKNAILERPE